MRQTIMTALVDMARDGKMPLVPSVMMGGDAGGGMAGLPGLILAMAAKDLVKGPPDAKASEKAVAPTEFAPMRGVVKGER